MPVWLRVLLTVCAGYLLGNFQTGVLVSKRLGNFDVREKGSGSAGTTNVLRTMGWLPSVLTMLGDILKGALGALVGMALLGDTGIRLGGLAAIVGHNWPVLYGFRGGKGIATSEGAILVATPWIALWLLACQFGVLALTHVMSIASIVSTLLHFVLSLLWHWDDPVQIAFAGIVLAIVLFTHRGNIARLRRKSENALNFREIAEIDRKRRQFKGKS